MITILQHGEHHLAVPNRLTVSVYKPNVYREVGNRFMETTYYIPIKLMNIEINEALKTA